jgi:hypothetical protein
MALETATYIDGLVVTNPLGTDAKSQGDDHIRLLKSTLKATFPNVTGALTATHTELNYVDGVTSAIQTQIDTKGAIAGQAWTGNHTFPTQTAADNSTKAATTAYVDAADALKANLASPALTGTPTAPTASPGTNTTQLATTAFATQLSFQAALPVQTGEAGKYLQTDGSAASWENISNLKSAKSAAYTVIATDRYKHFALTGTDTLTLTAAATLGDGFILYIRNDGTGVWTVDPDGAETIDGRATIKVYPGEGFAIISDGSAWRTFGRPRRVTIATATVGSAVAAVDFETGFDDTEFTSFEVIGEGLSSDASALMAARVKKSGAYATTGYLGTLIAGGAAGSSNTGYVDLASADLVASGTASCRLTISTPLAATAHGQLITAMGSNSNGNTILTNATQSTAAVVQGVRIFPTAGQLDAGALQFIGLR